MASLPYRRRSSHQQRSDSEQNSDSLTASQAFSEGSSAVTEDSQTVLLSPRTEQEEPMHSDQAGKPAVSPKEQPQEPRRCWICFADETEDSPTASAWRSPCPCALTAHEACLLDWIADMEAPNSRRRAGQQHKIECPQCKAEIVVARPKSWVVDGVRAVEDACHRAILPSVMLISATSVYRLFFEYGLITVEAVFGTDDAERLLAPLFFRPDAAENALESVINYFKSSLRLNIGLPLVPPVLILSRTSFGDGILPILPMLFLATSPTQDPLSDFGDWPPSAGLSFALLPYLRSVYNIYYEKVWGEKERRWLREIQPRSTSGDGEGENGQNNDVEEVLDDAENIIEINIDLLEDVGPPEAVRNQDRNQDRNQANELEGPPVNPPTQAEGADARPQQQVPDAQAAGEQPADAEPAADQRGALNFNITTSRLADTVLGALAFPFVSSIMGDALRLALPKTWTTASRNRGFLQSRWARTLVGGCLFVVLKDAITLYVRWKMARNHRKRRVLDYDKVLKKVIWS